MSRGGGIERVPEDKNPDAHVERIEITVDEAMVLAIEYMKQAPIPDAAAICRCAKRSIWSACICRTSSSSSRIG